MPKSETAPSSVSPMLMSLATVCLASTFTPWLFARDEKTPERGLVAEVGPARESKRERVELVPGASALQVTYLSALSRDPVWLPSWISTTVLPRAVELRVGGAPDSIPPLLRLPILVTLAEAR